jgi:hypothetical protein
MPPAVIVPQMCCVFGVGVGRDRDGKVHASIRADLPGVETYNAKLHATLTDFDEVTAFLGDLHNEWRTWGNLLDCAASDLCTFQTSLKI